MSLIQQALEKAAKARQEASAPQAVEVLEKPQTTRAVLESLHMEEELVSRVRKPVFQFHFHMPKISVPKRFLLGITIIASVVALVLCISWVLPQAEKMETRPVMLAGMSSITQMPQAMPVAGLPKLSLTGITESNGAKLALINDQVVGVGDRLLEKAIVKSITENTVVLDWNGRQIKLRL